jgi:hypothetical protein
MVPCTVTAGTEVLFVVGNTNLNTGDAAAQALMEDQLGLTVVPIASNQSQPTDADGRALVVISSTVSATQTNTKFRDVSVPVVLWEDLVYDEMNMATTGGLGDATDSTAVEIVDPSHPLAAGLAGTPAILTVGGDVGYGDPLAGALVAATVVGTPAQAAVFAYDTGSDMYNGATAQARRVALPFGDFGLAFATPDGERLALVAFCWAMELYP